MIGQKIRRLCSTHPKKITIFLLVALCAVYYLAFPVQQPDYRKFLLPWLSAITASENLYVFSSDFTNYTGGYVSVLWLMHFFDPVLSDLAIIKITAAAGSVSCAASVIYVLHVLGWDIRDKYNAAFGLLLLPSVWMNGIAWGQADAFYTTFLLLSFASIIKDRACSAMVLFCIAVSFKLQAIFFAPFLFGILLRRPKILVAMILLLPVSYLAVNALYLLAGRSVFDVFGIYFDQARTFSRLSMSAPNFWLYASLYIDEETIANNYRAIVLSGITVSAAIAGLLTLRIRKINLQDHISLLFWASFTLVLMPFLLPKMHERFFFSSEVFLYLLALNSARFIIPAVFIQIAALCMYSIYDDTLGIRSFLGWPNVALLGIMFMTCVVLFMFLSRKTVADDRQAIDKKNHSES